MTRRNFFAKLCAVATAPFAVKAIKPAFNRGFPKWLIDRRYWIVAHQAEADIAQRIEMTERMIKFKRRKHYKI